MKTHDLIDLLAARVDAVEPHRLERHFAVATAAAAALAVATAIALLGLRNDITVALTTTAFQGKIAFAVAVAALAGAAVARAARPNLARERVFGWALLPFAAILIAALGQVAGTEVRARDLVLQAEWTDCLLTVPLLALPAAVILGAVVRAAAPTDLRAAGALVGLASGGLGALGYGLRCSIDDPAYVGVWYVLAIALVGITGWLLGPRLLRW